MTPRRKIAGLCAGAALLLALAPSALAAPAGDEYLPKVPQSGAQSSSGGSSPSGGGTPTTTLPSGGSGGSSPISTSKDSKAERTDNKKDKDDKAEQQITPIGSSDSGDSGGGSGSGSILFNPIVLLMIAAVIAAAVGMTLLRRQGDGEDSESPQASRSGTDPGRREKGPRTPDGEIVTGPDRIA